MYSDDRQSVPPRLLDLPDDHYGRETSNVNPPVARVMEVTEKLIILDYHSAMN